MMENELETMRRQMTLLKEKLDRQTIVTDITLRETVCGVLSNDARHSVVWTFVAVFTTPFVVLMLRSAGFSAGLTVAFVAVIVLGIADGYCFRRSLHAAQEGTLLEVGRRMALIRKRNMQLLPLRIVLRVGWIVWLFTECLPRVTEFGALGTGVICCLLGVGMGVYMTLRWQRGYRRLQLQIDEFLEAEE